MRNHRIAGIIALAAALAAAGTAGCQDSGSSSPDTSTGLSLRECVKSVGWQWDFVIDADMNGIEHDESTACVDALTAQWYEESTTDDGFSMVVAWNLPPDCGPRSPLPAVDDVLCTIRGTHTWENVGGFDPAERMVLNETVESVSGDYDGDGADDQCGPAAELVGKTRRFVVTKTGTTCDPGTKVAMWEPQTDEREAIPALMFTDPSGIASPLVLCTTPGTVGPADHQSGRKICATAQEVHDLD